MPSYIETEPPFKNWKVLGPYASNNGTRRLVHLVRPDGSKIGISYARFLVCKREGRLLTKCEVVDHIDENPLNDSLDNLQILSYRENILKSRPARQILTLNCPECAETFEREKRQLNTQKGGQFNFCSLSCAAIFRRNRRKRKEPAELKHGQRNSYRKGCRCDLCKKAQRDYQREYVKRKRQNPNKENTTML